MRILFDDIIKDAGTITSATPSALYPGENLKHPIIARRYQGYGLSDIITIPYTSDQSMNCFYYSLQNFSAFSVVLKDSVGATLSTITPASFPNTGKEYFSTITGIRTIELHVTTVDVIIPKVRLGIIRAGLYYETKDFLNAYKLGQKDNSLYRKTAVGYTTNTHITPLSVYQLNFKEAIKSEADEINEKYKSNGRKPIFFDFTHDDSDYFAPLYGNVLQPPDPAKSDRRYSFSLKIEECK